MNEKDTIEFCKCNVIHEDVVDKVKKIMIDNETSLNLAEFFKIFSDPTRIKILYALSKEELCVCDIANLLNMNQSAISHQLRVLKQNKVIKYRRDGRVVYYSLDDQHIKDIFLEGLDHINE